MESKFIIVKSNGRRQESRPPYPNKFADGDIAILIDPEPIHFSDGTRHMPGERIAVTDQTKHYFNVWHHFYERGNSEKVASGN